MKCFWVKAAYSPKASREPGKVTAKVFANRGQWVFTLTSCCSPQNGFFTVLLFCCDCSPAAACTPHLLGPQGDAGPLWDFWRPGSVTGTSRAFGSSQASPSGGFLLLATTAEDRRGASECERCLEKGEAKVFGKTAEVAPKLPDPDLTDHPSLW